MKHSQAIRKSKFIKVLFILAVAASFVVSSSSIWDDDDSGNITLDLALLHGYDEFALPKLFDSCIFLSYEIGSALHESIALYLELHEKSPPFSS